MLTSNKTEYPICNEYKGNELIRTIYYKDIVRDDEKIHKYICNDCNREFKSINLLNKHREICKVRQHKISIYETIKEYKGEEYLRRKIEEDKKRIESEKLSIKTNGKFSLFINNLQNREKLNIFISGQSGCGKTTCIRDILLNYYKQFPNRRIILFSGQTQEIMLEELEIPKFKKILIDDSFIKFPISIDELRNSLVIFDDVDAIQNKKLDIAIQSLYNEILKNGRSHDGDRNNDIDCIITCHVLLGANRTKTIINESTHIILFPQYTQTHSLSTMCSKYIGLSNNDIKDIKSCKSRYIIIHKNIPLYTLSQKELKLIK
jgi:hypothetical protein